MCAAWCHSRWSVHERASPLAFVLVRRKKYVCTSICWTWNSPAAIRSCTYWCDGLNRRVWPTIATEPGRLGGGERRLGVGEGVGERDLDLHVLARRQDGLGLGRVQLGGGREDDRVHIVPLEDSIETDDGVRDAVGLGDGLGGFGTGAADDGDLGVGDVR